MTNEHIDSIEGYVEETMLRMGCRCDASSCDGAVEWDEERNAVRVSVPNDADHSTFCDMLARLLDEAGYSSWDVWCDHWTPSFVYIAEKQHEEDSE